MTYKYLNIRRALYEQNAKAKLNTNRRFSDMARLFRLPNWIMFGLNFISLLIYIVIAIIDSKSPFILIPIIIILLIAILSSIVKERYLYNDAARAYELSELTQKYEKYIESIIVLLENHGINSYEKLMKLKIECEKTLKTHEDKYHKLNNKVFDMLIGVPLGALIASLIYENSNAIPKAIGAIVYIGIAIIGVINFIKFFNYISDGYFKDKYFLDTINELEYSDVWWSSKSKISE